MIRAILDGTKTQTRRIVKPQVINVGGATPWEWKGTRPKAKRGSGWIASTSLDELLSWLKYSCPQGKPGDRLWVKETHAYFDADRENAGVVYRESDNGRTWEAEDEGWKWKPSLFMPRKWSRITLEVVSVRVERLNDCSEADAKAEGVEFVTSMGLPFVKVPEEDKAQLYTNYLPNEGGWDGVTLGPVESYQSLWESINGPESWALNPWVWVIEFKRIEP